MHLKIEKMIFALLKAISFGLILAIMPGAALFSILQTSISRGFKAGFALALGISFSDILLVSLCMWGFAGFIQDNDTASLVMGFVGGAILIAYGIYTLFNKKTDLNPRYRSNMAAVAAHAIETNPSKFNMFQYFFKGFIFNITNPFVWILWIGVVPMAGTVLKEQLAFLFCILATTFGTDTLKSFFANKIKKILTPERIFLINRIVGLVLAILGLVLIIRTIMAFH